MAIAREHDKEMIQHLRDVLCYHEDNGKIVWLITTGKAMVGDIAGRVNKNGYRYIKYKGVDYLAHRLAWALANNEWPPSQIDHINHKRDDNRLENLRSVSASENQRNRPMSCKNTSGIVGVTWCNWCKKWVAHIRLNGLHVTLGRFNNIKEASELRKSVEIEHGYHKNHGKQKGA